MGKSGNLKLIYNSGVYGSVTSEKNSELTDLYSAALACMEWKVRTALYYSNLKTLPLV